MLGNWLHVQGVPEKLKIGQKKNRIKLNQMFVMSNEYLSGETQQIAKNRMQILNYSSSIYSRKNLKPLLER